MKELLANYEKNKDNIKKRLIEFKNLPKENYKDELIFCLLTPQSNAYKCWDAVLNIKKLDSYTKESIREILKTRTRFHNNKSNYVLDAISNWDKINEQLSYPDKKELRNWLADNIKGMGLKEASHFLRNIGKSDNQIAILDRHILRNLHRLNVIEEPKIKNKNYYLDYENKFISFSKSIDIPLDELDLLFWSMQTGKIFK